MRNTKEGLRRGRYWNSGRRRRGGRIRRWVLSCFGTCRIWVAMLAQQNYLFFNHRSAIFMHHVFQKLCCSQKCCWASNCHLQLLFTASWLYAVSSPWKEKTSLQFGQGGISFSDILLAYCCVGTHWFPNTELTDCIYGGWSHFRFHWFYIWHMFLDKWSTHDPFSIVMSDLRSFLLKWLMLSRQDYTLAKLILQEIMLLKWIKVHFTNFMK